MSGLLIVYARWQGELVTPDDTRLEHLIRSADREKIEAEFNNTKRQSLNVVPGFLVSREWDLDTVIELEEREEEELEEEGLKELIIDALAVPLATWGETLS